MLAKRRVFLRGYGVVSVVDMRAISKLQRVKAVPVYLNKEARDQLESDVFTNGHDFSPTNLYLKFGSLKGAKRSLLGIVQKGSDNLTLRLIETIPF